MKFSLKTLAAAVALATVAAGANAAISTAGTAKNGSLVMFAYSASSGNVTGMFDLGLSIDQIIPSAGSINSAFTTGGAGAEIVWNFKTNTVGGTYGSSAAYVGATTGAWSTQYIDWMADLTGATDIRYAVIAASKETATDVRALSTTSEANKVGTTTKSGASQFSTTFDTFIAPHNLIGSHVGNSDGGSSSLDTTASAAKASASFGAGMNWGNKGSFNATAAAGTAMPFFYVDTSSTTTSARNIQFVNNLDSTKIATFNFNAAAGTLTYDVAAAAVPEPESYAMFLAGLGMLAAFARRRRAN